MDKTPWTVFIGPDAVIGEGCKIQNYAFIPDHVVLGKGVFVGPGAVFCNDKYPPSNGAWKEGPKTMVGDFAVIGANATILPGLTLGDGCVIGAGAVVTKNVPVGETWVGNPARKKINKENA